MARLRAPDGCPWDAQQSEETLKMYLLEEAYEVIDAVEKKDPAEICQELGDLLFQIVFLAQLAAERGEFDLGDVLCQILDKMIRRHPHVFGEARVRSAEEVVGVWAGIKEKEKRAKGLPDSPLDSIPGNLPALLWAHRALARVGPDSGEEAIWEGLKEAMGRLSEARSEKDAAGAGAALSGLLFVVVRLCRQWGFNAETLLRERNRTFLMSAVEGRGP